MERRVIVFGLNECGALSRRVWGQRPGQLNESPLHFASVIASIPPQSNWGDLRKKQGVWYGEW